MQTAIRAIASNPRTIPDDILFAFGSDRDIVALNRASTLAADTALTSVLIGTPESQAIAANSLIISNVTASGDIALYTNKGGNSQMGLWLDGSSGDVAMLAASGASVDWYIAGVKEMDYATGAMAFQQATTISTTTGDMTLDPTGELVELPANYTHIKVTETATYASSVLPDGLYLQNLSVGDGKQVGIQFLVQATDTTQVLSAINHVAVTSNSGALVLQTEKANVLTEMFRLAAAEVVVNETGGDIDFRVESDRGANLFTLDAGLDSLGIGAAASDGALFELTLGAVDRTAVSAVGAFNVPADTITYDNGSGTNAIWAAQAIGIQTLVNGTATLTLTDAASLYIAGVPVASTNVSIGTAYAFWVDAGVSRFDDDVGIGSTAPATRLVVSDALSSTTQYTNDTLLELTNTNQTANNWLGIMFNDANNGAGTAFIHVKFTDHTNNYGEMHFSVRGAGGLATRLLITPTLVQIGGGLALKSDSATEIGIQVTNDALTVGSAGSLVAPYASGTPTAFTDGIGGNLNGGLGINYDTGGLVSTLEARSNGAWVSVALTGALLQNHVQFAPMPGVLYHPDQVVRGEPWEWKDGMRLDTYMDESRCLRCGQPIEVGQDAVFTVNMARENGIHAIYSHFACALKARGKQLVAASEAT